MKNGQPNIKKEVIAVYINRQFNRVIKKSDVKSLIDIMKENKGVIGIEIVSLPTHQIDFEVRDIRNKGDMKTAWDAAIAHFSDTPDYDKSLSLFDCWFESFK